MNLHRLQLNGTEDLIAAFRARYPFELDDFQVRSLRALASGDSVLVSAPTGTGKTVVAEFGIFRAWQAGQRVMYTTPIKALSNQKYRDFRAQYGDAVGLLTGDVVENPQGQILVMTTEVLRNMLVQRPEELDDVGCVVFDEVHYLADAERGTTWEESMICCPDHVQLICLSATATNAAEIAAWISSVHQPVQLIQHTRRAVPLEHYYYLDGRLQLMINSRGQRVAAFPGVGGETRQRVRMGRFAPTEERPGKARREPTPSEIVASLEQASALPCIYFLFSRRQTEAAAEECARVSLATGDRGRKIAALVDDHLAHLDPADRRLGQVQRLSRLLRRGVAFHHAGMLPVLKVLVEQLFSAGLIGVVFATDTLSLGINMPAKTVVLGELTKFDGESRRLLIPNEYQQLTGRAGRRGMDEKGAAVIPYSPWVSWEESHAIATGELYPIESAFTVRYNTVLNLWTANGQDRLVRVLSSSLREFQLDGQLREHRERIEGLVQERQALPDGCLLGEEDTLAEYHLARRRLPGARKDVARAARAVVPSKSRSRGRAANQSQSGQEGARQRLEEARARLQALEGAITGSHCDQCPERRRHQELERERGRLREEQTEVQGSLERLEEVKRYRTRRLLRGIERVLERFRYVKQGQLTTRALKLRDVFDGNGLIICEMIERGLLDRCPPAEIAEVLSWFAYDRDTSFPNRNSLPARLWKVRLDLDKLVQQVVRAESQENLRLSTGYSPVFYGMALNWCQGFTFDQVLSSVGLTEGDIMLTFNKTLDLLRQLRDMLRRVEPSSPLLPRLQVAERLMRRGIVEQCCQIGVNRISEDGKTVAAV